MALNPFVAEIMIFAGNFAPKGYATTDGQILPISQNTALFSLLGTTYGGNGTSNFGLPNFAGRGPVAAGQGQGLSLYDLGQIGGSSTFSLTTGANNPATAAPIQAFTFTSPQITTRAPFLTLTYLIAMSGIFPPRP